MAEEKTIKQETEEAQHLLATAAQDAVKAISVASETAARAISVAAQEASKVVLTNATMTAKTLNVSGSNDHDFLLTFAAEVRTKLDSLSEQVQKLDNNAAKRIDQLEIEKLNCKDSYPVLYKKGVEDIQRDHESRINSCETNNTRMIAYGIAAIFVLTIVQWVISTFLKLKL